MKRPAFQFYPGDWRGNANLRRCSHAERGIWIEVMCLLHDSEEYGLLRWPLGDIAQAVGCKPQELRALAVKGVLKGCDGRVQAYIWTPRHAGKDGEPVVLVPEQEGPVWYSSRMVRDEYVRTKRGDGSRFEATPKGTPDRPPKASPKPPFGDGSSSSSSSSLNPLTPPNGGVSGKPDPAPRSAMTRERKAIAVKLLEFLNKAANRHYQPVESNIKPICARLAEMIPPDDEATVRRMIADRCERWEGDAKMDEYLRPATLFGKENFHNYVGQLAPAAPLRIAK